MKLQKVSICFSQYTDADLLTKAESVLLKMTGNAYFTNPIPTLADLKIAVEDYGAALVNAEDLNRLAVAQKNQQRAILERLLAQLGLYVMYIAMGDVTALTSSGFTLTKTGTPSHITAPGNVTLENGITSGELVSAVKTVPGAVSYVHEITPDPLLETSVWESNTSSKCKFTFANLQLGKKYWVRVAAVGSGDQIAYSPASGKYVQ